MRKKAHSDSTKKFSDTNMVYMLEFLIDNIFAIFGGRVFNKQSAYLWVQTVLLFLPTCSFLNLRILITPLVSSNSCNFVANSVLIFVTVVTKSNKM